MQSQTNTSFSSGYSMKYLSVIVFIGLMSWTWAKIHGEAPVSFETHAAIQSKLAVLLQEAIQQKKPEAAELVVERVWTEDMTNGHVKAHFVYSFSETASADASSAKTTVNGEGLLERMPDDGSGFDRWSLKEIKTTNNAVLFEQEMIVTPEDSPNAESKVTPQPSEPAPTEHNETTH